MSSGLSCRRRIALAGVSSLVVALALDAMHGRAVAQEYLTGINNLSNQTISNQTMTGGAGSGGGAGLGGAVFVGDGATLNLNNVDFFGNTAIGGQGGTGTIGGSMNGRAGGQAPSAANDGEDGSSNGAFVNSGDGVGGSIGANGADGTNAPGGAGGNGGDGSNGSLNTAELVKAIADQVYATYQSVSQPTVAGFYTALATALTTASGAAAVGGVNAGGPAPNAPLAAALTAAASQMTLLATQSGTEAGAAAVQVAAEAAYIAALQVTSYATGAAGLGGDGGDGGQGGAGGFGQGGGGGGDGGDGGNAVSESAALGGAAGNGGTGGAGGFGAGGGMGGERGSNGTDGNSVPPSDDSGFWGAGGAAGFGGGQGSEADGTENGTGGGGGSGLGGAIFVADGATLNISGNATFDGNSAFGGSSGNGGEAGQAAGSDLFMMTGSTVNLAPGEGNIITFNGTIADDSKASIDGTGIASGSGAGITVKSGRVIFNGENTYSGQTRIEGGVLQADDGTGIHENSNINLAGGVLQTSGTFDRHLGTAPDRLQWTGSGGLAAIGGNLTVRLNNGLGLTWAEGGFVTDGSSLLFGSGSADADVTFVNDVDLAGGTRTIVGNGGADGDNLATMAGVLSNGSLVLGDGSTEGTIALTAQNTYQGSTTVRSGTNLMLSGDGSIGSSANVTIEGSLDISAIEGGSSLVTISGGGSVDLGNNTLTISEGSTEFSGIISGAGGFTVDGGTQTFSGNNSYGGATKIAAGAELALKGDGEISASSGVEANGDFDIAQSNGATIKTLSGSGTATLGDQTLVISAGSTEFSGIISGTGGFTVDGGTQTLSGNNSYDGATEIAAGAALALKGDGEISASSGVEANGDFDIAQSNGATIKTLSGSGTATLGDQTLVVSAGSTEFSGIISGTGGFTVDGGTQTLSGNNAYSGATLVAAGAELALKGDGEISASSGVEANGDFDIAQSNGATITTLSGTGTTTLGSQTLVISAGSTEFSGVISGAGGLIVDGGTQTLAGANTFTGATLVDTGAELALKGDGDVSASAAVIANGVFNIAGASRDARINKLAGAGTVELGDRRLTVTDASSTFAGTINGSGGFAVSGGEQTLQGVISTSGLIAADGGRIAVNGGSVTAGTHGAALAVENGGTIETVGTVLQSAVAMVSAIFDQSGRVANITLGEGTVLDQDEAALLLVERSGAGADGVVNLRIDNGADVTGDVIDRDTKIGDGGTNVTIADGASWNGFSDAAGFKVETGGSATFAEGSRIDGPLTIEAGGFVDGSDLTVTGDASITDSAITGNVLIGGDLDLDGRLLPGQSPGTIAVSGNLTSSTDSFSEFEVRFGMTDPQAGIDYDQFSVGGDASGQLVIDLQRLNLTRGTELGDIGAIELVRVGGTDAASFELGERVTQNGHEVVLDRRMRAADPTALVSSILPGGGTLDEVTFFGAGDVTVYGLDAFVQDETFGLTALAGAVGHSIRGTLGTAIDRRGALDPAGRKSSWFRGGAATSDINDEVDQTQNLAFTEIGADLLEIGGLRLGLIGSYTSSDGDVSTNTGIDKLSGTLYSGGLQANWAGIGGTYVDAVGLYSFGDWTFTPTAASGLTADAETFTAVIEAGHRFGSETASITPWGQFTYQTTSIDNVSSDWVDEFRLRDGVSTVIRGGVRAGGRFNGVAPYADLALSHDLNGEKRVVVDNLEFSSGMGGTRAELGVGFAVNVNDAVSFSSSYRGAFGIETGGSSDHQGQLGLRAVW